MLLEFLQQNKKKILELTEKKTRDLAGAGPSSDQLERGLPLFYEQLMGVLRLGLDAPLVSSEALERMAQAARNSDEPSLAAAAGRDDEVELAKSAGRHGSELFRLGYTLSHVVHAYGAMCQSINELASEKRIDISPGDFRQLNLCLDVAIAGAVTEFESQRDIKKSTLDIEQLGFLAHELRNSLNTVTMGFQLIKDGTVSARGSTGQMLERGLLRLDELIERSLTEVRLKVGPKVHMETTYLLQLVDQIALTAKIQAKSRNQTLLIQIDSGLKIEADQQLMHSALSNLIQNSLKFSHDGGHIQVRGKLVGNEVVIEVEDECGGLSPDFEATLFKPFKQHNENREGLGLGLTITRRAIELNGGRIKCNNLPAKGCIFTITLPSRC